MYIHKVYTFFVSKISEEVTAMIAVSSNPQTKISTWGNSDAVRIPCAILRAVGLLSGDDVELVVNERNNIEIVPAGKSHRSVRPKRGVTFDALFSGYESQRQPIAPAWPDDDMMGAELKAWAR